MEALLCKETLSYSLILLSDSTMGVFWSLEWCQTPEHFWPFLTHHFSNLISSTYAILNHSKSHLFLWTHCNLFVFSVCDLFICAMELRPANYPFPTHPHECQVLMSSTVFLIDIVSLWLCCSFPPNIVKSMRANIIQQYQLKLWIPRAFGWSMRKFHMLPRPMSHIIVCCLLSTAPLKWVTLTTNKAAPWTKLKLN